MDTTDEPVFPITLTFNHDVKKFKGLTIHDYFAGQALIGILQANFSAHFMADKLMMSFSDYYADKHYTSFVIKYSLEIADAMLKAREMKG